MLNAEPTEQGAEPLDEKRRVHLIKVTQDILAHLSDDTDLALIRVAWTLRQHVTKPQGRQTPSRLPNIIADIREGKPVLANTEAQIYKEGASRIENAFLAALQEVPLTSSMKELTGRAEAISKHGGQHAVHAYNAVEDSLREGSLDKARSLLYDYGGIQALTIYAVTKSSHPAIAKLICDLSPSQISCVLSCISNVRLHSNVSYMIETLFRNRARPQFKSKKSHVGRAPRTKGKHRQCDEGLPQPAFQSSDSFTSPNTAQEMRRRSGLLASSSSENAKHAENVSQHQTTCVTRKQQLGQSSSWSNTCAPETDVTVDDESLSQMVEGNDDILDPGYNQFSEHDLSLFLEENFHFPIDS
ncbi:hypothetical protein FOVG_17307 [Fusarium oxysporum f. sp. pisi HDV247]|uniref:Uncharacterized protein n=1 Tax=Fusarium oxysporum f. sp. pisi HDV247 TaxID=1080344 RepID=W9NUH5_FUSOX|nr:hypothetical protein FOVG_17307 [Fusarium oxysporum f. sp. pisi HDV247]